MMASCRVRQGLPATLGAAGGAGAQMSIIDLARGDGAALLDLLEEKGVVRKDEVLGWVNPMREEIRK